MHRACCRDGCLRPGRRWGGDVHHLTEHAAAAHFAHERLTLFGESEKTEVGSGYQAAEQEVAVEEEVGQEADVAERLDHLGIVAGVCREIGLAECLDAQDERSHERVSVGTAMVAMLLNGLGFSNRQLYLVPQFFADKPVERLLGPGITPADLNDDCLGRTLDWLYAHDPTTLFAGIAAQARQRFGIAARQVHVDTTSFSVSGIYAPEEPEKSEERMPESAAEPAAGDLDAHVVAMTY